MLNNSPWIQTQDNLYILNVELLPIYMLLFYG
jgi:hypothetical protein